MRLRILLVRTLLLAALPLAGCASNGHGLVLDPVGPPVFQPSAGSNGTLVVFSAYDPNAHFNSLSYRRIHSGYSHTVLSMVFDPLLSISAVCILF